MLSMCSRRVIYFTATFVALILAQVASAAGDAERGKLLADTCMGCHGVDTFNNIYPTYHVPKVAGQDAGYIVNALTLYRDGQRDHGTMTAQASSLSDQDIQDIAAYMQSAGGKLDPTAPGVGTAPAAAQVCAACHGAAGISPIPANPHLAGQHLDYLLQALSDYRSGARKGPNAIAMQAQLAAVSEEELDAIALYFSEQQGLGNL
jgi:cytochrome c553